MIFIECKLDGWISCYLHVVMNKISSHLIKSAFTFKLLKLHFMNVNIRNLPDSKRVNLTQRCLFVCLLVRYGNVTFTGEGLQILTYPRQLWPLSSECFLHVTLTVKRDIRL